MMNRRNKAFLFAAVCVLLMSVVYLGWQKAESQSRGVPDFNQLGQPLPDLAGGEGEALVARVVSRLKGESPLPFPERLKKDREARICFITLADGKGMRKVAAGSGWGLSGALDQAIDSISKDPLSKGYRWIKLDLVKGAQSLENLDPGKPLPVDTSLFGMAVGGWVESALLPEELSVGATGSRKISLDRANRLLKENRVTPPAKELERSAGRFVVFNTISFFGDGKDAWPLFRGNREWRTYKEKDIQESLDMAGKYLSRSVRKDGKFDYQYDPFLDRQSLDYNLLRHAGTIYAMLELYGKNRDPELLQAAERAIGYLLRQVLEGTVAGRPVRFAVEDGDLKLGGNALAALALAEYERVTGDRSYVAVMKGLGEWMLATQDPDGRFTVHKQSLPGRQSVQVPVGILPWGSHLRVDAHLRPDRREKMARWGRSRGPVPIEVLFNTRRPESAP